MSITGIAAVIFAVDDLKEASRFLLDFGLSEISADADTADFEAVDGSQIRLRKTGHPDLLKGSRQSGLGAYECIWAVDRQENLDKLCAQLSVDHSLSVDEKGVVHFITPFGQAIGLKVWQGRPVVGAPSPSNTPGHIGRLNQPRKWLARATPRRLNHIVWTFPDVQEALDYYRDRLNFRVSDVQKGFGVYIRADGANEHHNIFLADANIKMPGFDGTLRFMHINFELEDIDEMMVAKNWMERRGYRDTGWGLGRHRLNSAAFLYMEATALGGEMEYGADYDMIDDSWKPRVWDAGFGAFTFVHNLPDWISKEPEWDVVYARNDELRFLPFGYQRASAPLQVAAE